MKKFSFLIVLIVVVSLTGCNAQPAMNTPAVTDAISTAVITTTSTPAQINIPATTGKFKLTRDTVIMTSGIKVSDCESFFELKYPELIKKLGNDYEKVMTGAENSWEGYHYAKLGITFVYNDYDYKLDEAPLTMVECDHEKIALNGIKEDMNYTQIQKLLGPGKTEIIPVAENNYYDLVYEAGDIYLIFSSCSKDGAGWWLTIQGDYNL
ncbi:MAG: hypothetical protein ACOYU3_05250 [Bacillota bacterium]